MSRLRCISLHQPWASLIAAGVKRHETRSFMPPAEAIGAPIVIHAAKRAVAPTELSPMLKRICFETFGGGGWDHRLPRGALICRGVLAAAVPAETVPMTDLCEAAVEQLPDILCGDFSPGRFAWRIDDVERLRLPVPWRALQRWFYVSDLDVA